MDFTAFQHFKQLHYQPAPLLLSTIWDARSAAISQTLGFAALGTSSAAIASMLGYTDGEQMPFAELRYVVNRICTSTTLPVSVDLEGGYSRDPREIARHIWELAALGVVGINLEDSVSENGSRKQLSPEAFSETLRTVRRLCDKQQVKVFLNIRTDTYLLGTANPLTATLQRLRLYEAAGADGLFVPGLTNLTETRDICRATLLPVNVMALPALSDFAAMAAAGVRRISMGNFLFEALARQQTQLSQQIQQNQVFTSLFA
jgi:2-methylisocitrate lyase-like PEP mutase family enzyme